MKILLYVFFILFFTEEATGQTPGEHRKCVFKRRLKSGCVVSF